MYLFPSLNQELPEGKAYVLFLLPSPEYLALFIIRELPLSTCKEGQKGKKKEIEESRSLMGVARHFAVDRWIVLALTKAVRTLEV